MHSPLMTFVTRCFKRPSMQRTLELSMVNLRDQDFEHVFIVDDVGRGVGWANRALSDMRNTSRVNGQYVYVVDDDNEIASKDLVGRVRALAPFYPAWIAVRSIVGGRMLPSYWGASRPPVAGEIDTHNMIVRRDVWLKHIGAFGQDRCGDFHFASALWGAGHRPVWLDLVAARTQRVSRGAPE